MDDYGKGFLMYVTGIVMAVIGVGTYPNIAVLDKNFIFSFISGIDLVIGLTLFVVGLIKIMENR